MNDIDEVSEIFRRIEAVGGKLLFVGGCVRDSVLGISPKDVDIEVYGLSFEAIVRALEGISTKLVGKNFGIMKLQSREIEIDLSVPRRGNNCGIGDDDFATLAPEMTPKEAAARRDFTVNALAMDNTGRILDYFGGLADLQSKTLRATSELFTDDALRVLRGMQLAARLSMQMDQRTITLCQSLVGQYENLATERIWVEFQKLMSRGVDLFGGLEILRLTHWLQKFPELAALEGCLQDPEWHPEGDAWVHTLHVCNAAGQVADREQLSEVERLTLMFSALLHDVGKPATTVRNDTGRWVSPKHAQAGAEPTLQFLQRIGAPQWLIDQVIPLVVEHMAHVNVDVVTPAIVRRLANRLSPASMKLWSYLVEADHAGRPPLPMPSLNPTAHFMATAHELAVKDSKPKPILLGRDLIAIGLKPGPSFGEILDKAYEAQLDGAFETHDQGLAWLAKDKKVN